MSGDNGAKAIATVPLTGSPPHEWGQLLILRSVIPHHSVHPHMSGDNATGNVPWMVATGSPPHEWGQLYALSCFQPVMTVHPHMSGDNYLSGHRLT